MRLSLRSNIACTRKNPKAIGWMPCETTRECITVAIYTAMSAAILLIAASVARVETAWAKDSDRTNFIRLHDSLPAALMPSGARMVTPPVASARKHPKATNAESQDAIRLAVQSSPSDQPITRPVSHRLKETNNSQALPDRTIEAAASRDSVASAGPRANEAPDTTNPTSERSGAVTESDLEGPISLRIVESYAASHNPAIRRAMHTWRGAQRKIAVARSYDNPTVTYWPDTGNMANTRSGLVTTIIGVSQAIPFPGKLTLRGKVAEESAHAARLEMRSTSQEVARVVWQRFADYYLAVRELEVNAATTELTRQIEADAEARYRVGKTPQQDVIQAQEELTRLAAERVEFEAARDSAAGALNTALDRPPYAPLGRPTELATREPSLALVELISRSEHHRSELEAQRHRVAGSQASLKLAQMGYLPDFVIGGQYWNIANRFGVPGYIHQGHDVWMAEVGISIPLWVNRISAEVDEARAGLMMQRARLRELRDEVFNEVQEAYRRLRAAARMEAIFRTTLIPQTRERFKAARAGYETGQVDFQTVVDSVRDLELARLKRYQAVWAYHRSAADLERATGIRLPAIPR